MLWVKDGDYVRPVEVRVGQTDSTLTEVSGADLAEGMEVVIGEVRDHAAADATTNPFAPQFFRGNRPGGQGGAKGQSGTGGGTGNGAGSATGGGTGGKGQKGS